MSKRITDKIINYILFLVVFFLIISNIFLLIHSIHRYIKKSKKVTISCPIYKDFSQAHWPNHLENECFPELHDKCCNISKDDKGGLTCYGVAIGYNHPFFEYLKLIGHDLTELTPKQAKKIDSTPIEPYAKLKIYSRYYKAPKIDELHKNIRQLVFDNSVHAGPSRAIKTLQQICSKNIKTDGIIGPKTINCSKLISPRKYVQTRTKWLQSKSSWKENPRGFKARMQRQIKQNNFAIKNTCYKK